eukprot:XP_001692103.1 predicted protein [Chlamydomonas reinhardtii]
MRCLPCGTGRSRLVVACQVTKEQRAPLPQQLAAGLLAVTSAAALALTVAPMDAAAVSGGGGPSEGLAGVAGTGGAV